MIKKIIKQLLPPIIYSKLQEILHKKIYKPIWNTLNFEPLTNLKIFFDPTGPWQKKMISNKYDNYLFDQLKLINLKGKVVYDIGAHIGFHSYYFSRLVGKDGKVFAFEPNKKNVERIIKIINQNKDIKENTEVFNVAISNKIGKDQFNINNDIESGRSSGNFIGSADTFWSRDIYENKDFIKTEINTVSIDLVNTELGINKLPDIVKIDVEGAEYLVLEGAKNTLLTKKPIIFIEVHSILNMYKVLSFLNSISYKYKILNSESNGPVFIEATTM